MVVSFQKKHQKEPLRGCIVCEDQLDELLETRMIRITYGRRRGSGRGRRGRRGRGGRGRREGGSHPSSKPKGNTSLGDFF